MLNSQPAVSECTRALELFVARLEGRTDSGECNSLDRHLAVCGRCQRSCKEYLQLHGAMNRLLGSRKISNEFDAQSTLRLKQQRQIREAGTTSSAALSAVALSLPQADSAAPAGSWNALQDRLGAAPWWAVSVVLHVLVIILLGLITMSIGILENTSSVIVLTKLEKMTEALPVEEAKKSKSDLRDILEVKQETPATDPNSALQSNIVVPPEILAQAELGDHFETINLDRPDTQSAFGNPDARMFHSVSGNDEPEGGGGLGGTSLMDDLIGMGGSVSPGTGGGWGGGNGTGTGIGNGAGHGSFGMRNGGGRKLMVMRHGGSKATESAVDAALAWLARNQEADGHWDLHKHEGGQQEGGGDAYDPGISALATLAFLGAGHTQRTGKYKDNVKRATTWMIAQQLPDGSFNSPKPNGYDIYDTALCTLALAEAFGMEGGRAENTYEAAQGKNGTNLQSAAQKGVDYLVKVQQPHGGWNHGTYASTSVFGWVVMALKSAKVAKLNVPKAAFEGATRRLEDITEKDSGGYWGHVGYTAKSDYNFGRMTTTAIGMVALQFMGRGAETTEQARIIADHPPHWSVGPKAQYGKPVEDPQGFYHWYYGTLGIFQAGGGQWKTWNEGLKAALLPNQIKGGEKDGSWDPVTTWDLPGGRVFSTALGALCLEVYYRYLPLYR